MVIGNGSGTYDVLRWDGTCSRGVEAEVLGRDASRVDPGARTCSGIASGRRRRTPSSPGATPSRRAHAKRGKECQGATSGDVSKSCEAADQALIDAIVDYVRTRGGLPEPVSLP